MRATRRTRAYRTPCSLVPPGPTARLGDLPPADTAVLLGYVRSAEQWALDSVDRPLQPPAAAPVPAQCLTTAPSWVRRCCSCMSRGDARAPRGCSKRLRPWQAATAENQMRRLGYPNPRGHAYLLAQDREATTGTRVDGTPRTSRKPRARLGGASGVDPFQPVGSTSCCPCKAGSRRCT